MSIVRKSKVSNGLMAASAGAVLAVYAAGYSRTRSAAEELENQSSERRPAVRPVRVPAAQIPKQLTVVPAAQVARPVVAAIIPPKPKHAATPGETAPWLDAVPEPPPQPLTPVPPPQAQAPALVVAPPTPAAPPPVYKDGTYTGWGTSRHGDIMASVVIENGRIASAKIADCRTRYSCDVIDKLPPQVAQRQSPEVDFVSGATQSTNAFYYGVVEALNKAK